MCTAQHKNEHIFNIDVVAVNDMMMMSERVRGRKTAKMFASKLSM